MTPKLTDQGKNLLLRALAGENIEFTKIQIGNGPEQNTAEAETLVNPIITAGISKITMGKDFVTLTAEFTNSSIASGFHITEAGFYAKDPTDDSKELLYAVGCEDESCADYVPACDDRIIEMQFAAVIFIGDAENVSAAISSSLVYTSKDDFDNHTANRSNPHHVTKSQIGLGNVPNVSTDDQTPTFAEANTLMNINTGENMSVLFGKIKRAITNLMNHLNNKGNPHNCTATQVGAAAKNHTHNVQDINAGTLQINRGGTGCSNLSEFVLSLAECGAARVVTGSYVGTGEHGKNHKNELSFTSPAKLLIVMPAINTGSSISGGFAIVNGATVSRPGGLANYTGQVTTDVLYFFWENNVVSWYSTSTADIQQNQVNTTYVYFAIL